MAFICRKNMEPQRCAYWKKLLTTIGMSPNPTDSNNTRKHKQKRNANALSYTVERNEYSFLTLGKVGTMSDLTLRSIVLSLYILQPLFLHYKMTIKVEYDPSRLYYFTQCDRCYRIHEIGRESSEVSLRIVPETNSQCICGKK